MSNRLLYALSMLFALPFLGGGGLALLQGIRQYGTGQNAIVLIVVGAVCIAIGLLVMWGLRSAASANAKSEALEAQYPGKPWMWREEWVNRSIRDSNRLGAIGMWIFAFFWNAIAIPMAVLIAPSELAKENYAALLILIFPLVGIFVLIAAIYQTLRSIRFGTSMCHLQNVPIVPGRKFRGDVEIGNDTTPEDGYHFRVASLQALTTGTGKNRSTTEHTLWDEEIEVDAAAAMRSPTGVRVPFELATPADGHTTDESDSSNRYFWRLYATAQFAGVDYAAQFQIPVFQTGEAVDGSEFAAFEQRHRSEAVRHELSPSSGVEVSPRPEGGEEFRIQAKKTIGGMLRSLLFLVILNAALAALIHYNAPICFPRRPFHLRSARDPRQHRLPVRKDDGDRRHHGRQSPEGMARRRVDNVLRRSGDRLDRRCDARREQHLVVHRHAETQQRRDADPRRVSARSRERRHRRSQDDGGSAEGLRAEG